MQANAEAQRTIRRDATGLTRAGGAGSSWSPVARLFGDLGGVAVGRFLTANEVGVGAADVGEREGQGLEYACAGQEGAERAVEQRGVGEVDDQAPGGRQLWGQRAVIRGREHGGDRETDGGGGRGDVRRPSSEAIFLPWALVDRDHDEGVAGLVSGELAVKDGLELQGDGG